MRSNHASSKQQTTPALPLAHVLGVEGGGSHTVAALFTPDGRPLSRTTLDMPSNLAKLSLPEGLCEVFTVLRRELEYVPEETGVISGFAGAGTPSAIAGAHAALTTLGFSPQRQIISDAALTLEAVGGDGIVFIAGTGSICLGRRGHEEARHGGHGYILGDEASGFYVARRALNGLLNSFHGTERPSVMAGEILKVLGIHSVVQIKDVVYGDTALPKESIAALAPIVFEAAVGRDPLAMGVVSEAVDEMVHHIDSTRRSLDLLFPKCKVGLRGGLFRSAHANKLLIEPLERRLSALGGAVDLVMLEAPGDSHRILVPAVQGMLARGALDQERVAPIKIIERDTERNNKRSRGMDAMSGQELVELFASANYEVLSALESEGYLLALDGVAEVLRSSIDPVLVIGGAGTSGRIAHYLAEKFQRDFDVRAWIAGGEKAVREAVEGAEDDPVKAYREVTELLEDGHDPFFIGVSCGLSAPCVAGGLLAARDSGAGIAVLGMTPLDTARNEEVPGSGINFAHVARDLERNEGDRFFPLTLSVGPEVLQGSSRLKGGTATWITLHALLRAIRDGGNPSEVILAEIGRLQKERIPDTIGALIERAGEVIRQGGSLIYVAEGEVADAASLDASECSPTFGVEKGRVRVVQPSKGALEAAEVNSSDLIIYLGDADPTSSLAFSSGAASVRVPVDDFISAKTLVLNPISTGAFTRAGYVYGNRMINVRPSNTKLYDRALGTIMTVAGVGRDEAHRSLVSAIVESDSPTLDELTLSKAELSIRSGRRSRVVPLAIALASGRGIDEAQTLIESGVPLRRVVEGA